MIKFRSGAEARFASYLKGKRVFYSYEGSYIPYQIVEERKYLPDFAVTKSDGDILYLEVKGYFKSTDRKKMLKIKESNPNVDIRFIFMQDNRINKKSNTRYSDWCNRHGFKFNIGLHLPKEWLNEL